MISIETLQKDRLEEFYEYLSRHISENGEMGHSPFFPLSAEQSVLSEDLKGKFELGINKAMHDTGWRKVWIAVDDKNKIVGHIDIRPHQQLNTKHRVLLGMGVDRNFRKLKIGQLLLEFIVDYCRSEDSIAWIDLEVMENNMPAINLYRKLNFIEKQSIKDMFRIEDHSFNYTLMTLQVSRNL